jgi:hypothetical protein
LIKKKLQIMIDSMAKKGDLKFHKDELITDAKVICSKDSLATCLKFDVINKQAEKLIQFKFYDKLVSLVGKNGRKMVSSQINKIVGSTHQLDSFQERIRRAKCSGMTRLEVSFHFGSELHNYFGSPFMKSNFKA